MQFSFFNLLVFQNSSWIVISEWNIRISAHKKLFGMTVKKHVTFELLTLNGDYFSVVETSQIWLPGAVEQYQSFYYVRRLMRYALVSWASIFKKMLLSKKRWYSFFGHCIHVKQVCSQIKICLASHFYVKQCVRRIKIQRKFFHFCNIHFWRRLIHNSRPILMKEGSN